MRFAGAGHVRLTRTPPFSFAVLFEHLDILRSLVLPARAWPCHTMLSRVPSHGQRRLVPAVQLRAVLSRVLRCPAVRLASDAELSRRSS